MSQRRLQEARMNTVHWLFLREFAEWYLNHKLQAKDQGINHNCHKRTLVTKATAEQLRLENAPYKNPQGYIWKQKHVLGQRWAN